MKLVRAADLPTFLLPFFHPQPVVHLSAVRCRESLLPRLLACWEELEEVAVAAFAALLLAGIRKQNTPDEKKKLSDATQTRLSSSSNYQDDALQLR